MRDPLTLHHVHLADLVRKLQWAMYLNDAGDYDPDHEVNGADLVDYVNDLLINAGLGPGEGTNG